MIDYSNFSKYIILGLFVLIIIKLSYPNIALEKVIFVGLTVALFYAILDKINMDNFAPNKQFFAVKDHSFAVKDHSFVPYENTLYNQVEDNKTTAQARLDILYNQEKAWYTKLRENMRPAYIAENNVDTSSGINIIEPETWGKSPNLQFQEIRRIIPQRAEYLYDDEYNKNLLSEYNKMHDYVDMKDPKIDDKNYGYKLMFGEYAWGVLHSGYNEYIQEHNKDKINAHLSKYPDAIITHEMYPSNISTFADISEVNAQGDLPKKAINPEIYSDFTEDNVREGFTTTGPPSSGATAGTTAGTSSGTSSRTTSGTTAGTSGTSSGTTTGTTSGTTAGTSDGTLGALGTSIPTPDISYSNELDNASRIPNILYSGDLVMLFSPDKKKLMQRGSIDSQIVFDQPLKYIGTNLSKVRFVLKKQADNLHNYPISYGDVIYLKHNIYYNNKNTERFIKYGDRLQSHQDGNLFNEYVILNKANFNDKSHVQLDKSFLLTKNETTTSATFLKIELNGTVSSAASVETATEFYAVIYRPAELYNKHLDIAMNDIIFP